MKYLLLLIALLTVSNAFGYISTNHIGLLTVSETANSTYERGGTADLSLTIKPGTGRIFIDSFPLSKIDTQVTMRFAAELACDYLSMDCSHYDFFYTIKADSALVGGPSAGAAATVLTASMLDNQQLDPNTVMTGTINSGFLVGAIAGTNAKALAAQSTGYTKILLPKWDITNQSALKGVHIIVVPVNTLDDVMYSFTGKNYTKPYTDIVKPDDYSNIMKQVTIALCSKYGSYTSGTILMPNITEILGKYNISDNKETIKNITPDANNSFNITANITSNLSEKDYFGLAMKAISVGDYYSAASYCFGGNVRIREAMMSNLSNNVLKHEFAVLLGNVTEFSSSLDSRRKSQSTISQLETSMIVEERLADTRTIMESIDPNNISISQLAYAEERFSTTQVWSEFYTMSSPKLIMDDNSLLAVCNQKISEAEERVNYVQLYVPSYSGGDDLTQAYAYYTNADYASCIYTASKAKADADVVLGALFVSDSNINQYLNEKLDAAHNVIVKEQQQGIFPILGYSYYEYAKDLSKTSPYSALVYAEYALELGNLEMYFPRQQPAAVMFYYDPSYVAILILGFGLGMLVMVIVMMIYVNRRKKNVEKNMKSTITDKKRRKK